MIQSPLHLLVVADAVRVRMPVDSLNMAVFYALLKSNKNVKEWRLYIEFETNHTIWTNSKPVTGKIFRCTTFGLVVKGVPYIDPNSENAFSKVIVLTKVSSF